MEFPVTTQPQPRWRIGDKAFLGLSLGIIVLTWTLLVVAYRHLPTTIPGHYDVRGLPDAMVNRTWWSVFAPGLMQVVLTAATWWLSRHPEYSNLPTRVRVDELAESVRTSVKRLLSHLLVMTGVIANLIFAELSLATVRVGLGLTDRLNAVAVFGLVALLLILLTSYSIKLSRLVRRSSIPPRA